MNRYRNNYDDSQSDKYSEGTWVYINGELYHAGIKGMHWYQHLPGTDWWKAAKRSYSNYMNKNTTATGGPSKLQGAIATAKNVGRAALASGKAYLKGEARYYGNKIRKGASNAYNAAKTKVSTAYGNAKNGVGKFWNKAKGYPQEKINKFKESARNAYSNVRKEVQNVLSKYYDSSFIKPGSKKSIITGKSGDNELYDLVTGQYKEAIRAYDRKLADGPIGKQLNSFIQIAKYNVVAGCARWLDSIGMDDEVASFLKKLGIK